MTEVKFYRKNHIITDLDGKIVFEGAFKDGKNEYPSVNAAKRKSRDLQQQHGQGCLRVKS
jgi:hypothetical protein